MLACVGGFTTADRDGRGDGIRVYRVPGPGQPWELLGCTAVRDNPSMLRLGPDGVLYAGHGGRDWVGAYAVDRAAGRVTLLGEAQCGGTNPADFAILPSGRALVAANYGSGCVAVLPLNPDGVPGAPAQVMALEGQPGPHPKEQASSHPHGVTLDPSGRFAVVPDKGLDRTFVFRVEGDSLLPAAAPFVASRPGAGPRHAAFHPALPVLYVVNELDSTVETFRWDAATGGLDSVQVLPAVPADAAAGNTGAEILVDAAGRCVYASNRGHDSIAAFAVDAAGLLRPLGHAPAGGREPRFFALDPGGAGLAVANQASDTIAWLPLDADGRPGAAREVARAGSPSALVFLPE